MRIRDLLRETWSALNANRGRSALTILGIVIGISAVIAMTSLIGGVRQALVSEMGLDQARLVSMYVWGDRALNFDDIERIKKGVPGYEFVSGMTNAGAEVSSGTKQAQAMVLGVKPEYFEAAGTKFVQGRPFNEQEEAGLSQVVVLDKSSLKTLFDDPEAEAVGQSVKLGTESYLVVGVSEASGAMWGGDMVRMYAPFNVVSRRITGVDSVDEVFGFAEEGQDIEQLVARTKDFIASYFDFDEEERENNMYVESMQSIIDQLDSMMASFSLLMTAIAGISLVVGGIGIMNMMLTNVTERMREIGLRKALGAKRSDITKQFLLESIALCLTGGAIGVVFGYLAALALSGVAGSLVETGELKPVIDLGMVLMAATISVAIGVLFGFGPARRAAKLDPVESLHYQ